MAQESEDLNSIVMQIACTSLLNNEEYQYTEDKSKRKYLFDRELEKVNESINDICASVEKKLSVGIEVPANLRVEIARQMLFEVSQNPSVIESGFNFDEESIMKTMNLPIKDEENENENENKNKVYIYTEGRNDQEFAEIEERKEKIEEINKLSDELSNDGFLQIWGNSGKQENKNEFLAATIAVSQVKQFLLYDVKIEELDESEKNFLLAGIRKLNELGYNDQFEVVKKYYGIDDEMIFSEDVTSYTYEEAAKKGEEAIMEREIIDTSISISAFIKYGNKLAPEQYKMQRETILTQIKESKYPIDSALEALVLVTNTEKYNKRALEIIDTLNDMLGDESKKFECDTYTVGAALFVANKLRQESPEKARELIEGFNGRLKEQNYEEIPYEVFEKLCDLKDFDGNPIILSIQTIAEYIKYNEEKGLEKFIADIKSGKIKRETKEIYDYKENRVFTNEEKKEYEIAKKNDFIEMKEKFGLDMALGLAYAGMNDENEKSSRNIWLTIMDEQFDLKNIKEGKSSLTTKNLDDIASFFEDIAPNEKTEEQKRYLRNLSEVSKKLELLKAKNNTNLLEALNIGYNNMANPNIPKEEKNMWKQIMIEACDCDIIKRGESVIEWEESNYLKDHIKEIGNSQQNEMQREYIVKLGEQLNKINDIKAMEKVDDAPNVFTNEALQRITGSLNIFETDNSRRLYDAYSSKFRK